MRQWLNYNECLLVNVWGNQWLNYDSSEKLMVEEASQTIKINELDWIYD